MAHQAQREFCRSVRERFPGCFSGRRVLEIGSRNINGSLRSLFADCDYTGVDCDPGDGVDIVCFGHEFAGDPHSFDVVCSAETFEHDPHAERTVGRMLSLLKPGGLFFMTCAGEGRPEHGTRRTGAHYGPFPEFYRNVTMTQWLKWITPRDVAYREIVVRYNPNPGDLYSYLITR